MLKDVSKREDTLLKRAILIVLFVFIGMTSLAETKEVVHVVKKGDTLWRISGTYLNTPLNWPLLWSRNKEITNPHLIYPGDKVIIRWIGNNVMVKVVPKEKARPVKTIKLSKSPEHMNSVIISPEYSGLIYTPEPITCQGSILRNEDGPGEFATLGDTVSIKVKHEIHSTGRLPIVSRESVIRAGGIIYGYVYRIAAIARPVSRVDNMLHAKITYSVKEVTKGDLLCKGLGLKPLTLDVSRPKLKAMGHIIGIYGDTAEIGPLNVVFIDLGKKHGLKGGSLLGIYKAGSLSGPGSGGIQEGKLLVLKVLGESSMALVFESKVPLERDVLVGDFKP